MDNKNKFRVKNLDRKGDWVVFSIPHKIIWEGVWDLKTLGKFTGMVDSKGVEIFEGDIVSYELGGGKVGGHGYVDYQPEVAAFVIDYWKKGDKSSDAEFLHHLPTLEVVGNVHDNPELL